jgi:outer membrane protein OmpA-like peptidoglycan-associated protein
VTEEKSQAQHTTTLGEMSMSGSNSPLVRPLVLILAAALIGVYALYAWYTAQLTKDMAEKDTAIAEERATIAARDLTIEEQRQEIDQLNARLKDLADDHADEKQALAERLSIAQQANSELQRGIASLHLTDTDALAAERSKIADVTAERDRALAARDAIEAQYEASLEKVANLKAELAGLGQVIADSAAEHRAQVETLERHLNERVELAKATPADAELLRAARAAGLLPESVPLDDDQAALEERLAKLQREAQEEREAMQGEADVARAQYREQLAALETELQAARTALETERAAGAAALEAAQSEHARALAEAETRLAERGATDDTTAAALEEVASLQARLETAEMALAQVNVESETAPAAGAADLQRQLQEGEAKLAELNDRLAREQADSASRLEAQQRVTDELNAALESANSELAQVRNQLAMGVSTAQSEQSQALDEAQARIEHLETTLEGERRAAADAEGQIRRESESQVSGLRGLYRHFSALGGTHTERGMLLKLGESELRFPTGTSTLPNEDLPSLDRIAELLAEHVDLQVRIEGYTDSQGDAQANLALSRERAEAVRQALLERGVAPARVTAEGMGAERPIADNATAPGRAQNRRVEVYVVEG